MLKHFYYLFIQAPKRLGKPQLESDGKVNATSASIKWADLANTDVHGIRKNWILAYIPVRDPLDTTVFIASHYKGRSKRATFDIVTDGLQTDW